MHQFINKSVESMERTDLNLRPIYHQKDDRSDTPTEQAADIYSMLNYKKMPFRKIKICRTQSPVAL